MTTFKMKCNLDSLATCITLNLETSSPSTSTIWSPTLSFSLIGELSLILLTNDSPESGFDLTTMPRSPEGATMVVTTPPRPRLLLRLDVAVRNIVPVALLMTFRESCLDSSAMDGKTLGRLPEGEIE